MLRVVITLLLGLTLLAGCDQRVESFDPDEIPAQPDLSRIFPPEAAAPPTGTEAPSMPPAPPGQRRGAPPGQRRGAPPVAASGAPIRGTVRLAPGREEGAREGVLFVIARSPEGGPPLAVKRIQGPSFPLEFELGPGDRMVEARPFAGPLVLYARLDADGNATSRDPGDRQGAAPGLVNPGDSGIELLLE
jgi:cytochrome c-type biogenesis protein CcmH